MKRIPSLPMMAVAVAVGLLCLVTGGCTYELRGRVLDTGFESIQIVSPTDGRLEEGNPVIGARVTLTRDPGSLSRSEVTSVMSGSDGWFTIKLDEFGSGWMDEQWGIRVARSGYTGVEDLISLPFDANKGALLVNMARGPARRGADSVRSADLTRDADRFWSSPGGR
ncbi:MAG: hypothetical protein KF724_02805 [Phycisphaeraceae bacterium]|nr:hypothetical protein [Phycisphaeraceae bacterium]